MKNRKSTNKAVNNNVKGYPHVWISRPFTKGYNLIASDTREKVRDERNIRGASHYGTPEKIIIID